MKGSSSQLKVSLTYYSLGLQITDLKIFYLFLINSMPDLGLQLKTLRSRAACSTLPEFFPPQTT